VIVTRIAIVVGVVIYAGLWALAFRGATFLYPLLAIPLVLVALIGLGSWLTRYIGAPTHASKFHRPNDDEET
jgi:hypothetical protein